MCFIFNLINKLKIELNKDCLTLFNNNNINYKSISNKL